MIDQTEQQKIDVANAAITPEKFEQFTAALRPILWGPNGADRRFDAARGAERKAILVEFRAKRAALWLEIIGAPHLGFWDESQGICQ